MISAEKKATIVATATAILLTLIKLSIGLLSGSVAVLASAMDSILDMFVSIFNYFAISKSEKGADEIYNYGRGKIEALASVIEGTVITVSGLYLFYSAIHKYIVGKSSSYLNESLLVMAISLVITIVLVIYLNYIAKKTNNMVIKADALHYKTDVWTNIAVLASVGLVYITKIELFDIIIGGAISIYIVYSAYELIKEGVEVLLDKAVEDEIVDKIKQTLIHPKITNYHFLKTRRAGKNIFVDVHLVFDMKISLYEAHSISDIVEEKIKQIDSQVEWVINIHLDPYDDSVQNIPQSINDGKKENII